MSSSFIPPIPLSKHKRPSLSSLSSHPKALLTPLSRPSPPATYPHLRPIPNKRPRPAPHIFNPIPPPSPPLDELITQIQELANSRGALGRGVRATLRAFHRRASYLLSSKTPPSLLYVEIGPSYVRSTAALSQNPQAISRYAVETKAWPALRSLLKWQETTTTEARLRNAPLRGLHGGSRYGRHVFIHPVSLRAIIHVAEDLIGDTYSQPALPNAIQLEAIVDLPKKPLANIRAVAARCPRRSSHSNGDRNPSLMLWINEDNITGGAMCPVCTSGAANTTWRVHYLPDGTAALFTPRKRIKSPDAVRKVVMEYQRRERISQVQVNFPNKLADIPPPPSADKPTSKSKKPDPLPVGGCVLSDPLRISQMGTNVNLAYVTALLRLTTYDNTTSTVDIDGLHSRTSGSMARHPNPIDILLWSERRSKGPLTHKRAVESLQPFDFPTPLISISTMTPTAWRDVQTATQKTICVPAGWKPSAQAWVLFDIDDTHAPPEGIKKLGLTLRRDKQLSGRCMVIQTSANGLHVWAELREIRDTPKIWFEMEETREWYSSLGEKLLRAIHRGGGKGGKVDMSSCSAGGFARRPGWRLLRDGKVFRSRVVMHVPSPVRGRKPRLE